MLKKPNRKRSRKGSNKKEKRAIESTQSNIPIKDMIDGVIVTDDDRYVKVLEVLAIPFFNKKPDEQNRIIKLFQRNFLKSAPNDFQIKIVSTKANLTYQMNNILKNLQSEENDNCRTMGYEYEKRIEYAQNYGVNRRYFISFQYEDEAISMNESALEKALNSLNTTALNISNDLKKCGNAVLYDSKNTSNSDVAELLYTLLNRKTSQTKPFSERAEEVYRRYYQKQQKRNINIPPTDYISPNKITYLNSKYTTCDDVYYRFLYIPATGYNTWVYHGWIDSFANTFDGVDIDMFFHKKDRNDKIYDIRRNSSYVQTDTGKINALSDRVEYIKRKRQDTSYLISGLNAGQNYFEVETIITVTDTDKENIDFKVEQLKRIGETMDITLKELTFQGEEAFKTVLPLCKISNEFRGKMSRNMLSEGASSFYPFTTFQMVHNNGIYIADDAETNSPFVPDFFYRAMFTNPHMFICGTTGAGKTVTEQAVSIRSRVQNIPVMILSPDKQKEFKDTCNEIGGEFIDISPGSPDRINIMEIFMVDEIDKEDYEDVQESASLLMRKISKVVNFFNIFLESNGEKLDLEVSNFFNEALLNTYKKYGITPNNESLWADKEKTRYKEMPIIEDLVEELAKNPKTQRLSNILRIFVTGSLNYLNGRTNVSVTNKYTVFGLENNPSRGDDSYYMTLAFYVVFDFCESRIRRDISENMVLAIDEAWRFMDNKYAANSIDIAGRIFRAFSCSLMIATQQMKQFMNSASGKGALILGNCDTKIILKSKKEDLEPIQETLSLSEIEKDEIQIYDPGEGLFINSKCRMKIKFNLTELERLLLSTDKDTKEEYKRYKKAKRKEKEFIELSKNAKPINEYFDDDIAYDLVVEDTSDIFDDSDSTFENDIFEED